MHEAQLKHFCIFRISRRTAHEAQLCIHSGKASFSFCEAAPPGAASLKLNESLPGSISKAVLASNPKPAVWLTVPP